jgi:hypothetical protein
LFSGRNYPQAWSGHSDKESMMNTKNLLIASLVGGLISTVLVNTPFVNLINVLLCVGFWVGPIAAVWVYRRLGSAPTLGEAVLTGILAGAWHGLFGLLLSPLGLAGAGGLLKSVADIVPADDLAGMEASLSGIAAILFNLVGVVIDIAFGLVGGLIGGVLFGSRRVMR